MSTSNTMFAMRAMMDLMDYMRRRQAALDQAYVLDMRLGHQLNRLVNAYLNRQAAFQYALGLNVIVIWDIKRLYEMSANRSAYAAQRTSVRLAHLARNELALELISNQTTHNIAEEMRAQAQFGIEPEDLYIDVSDDETNDNSTDDMPDDDDSDDGDADDDDTDDDDAEYINEASPGKLKAFIEWDFLNRAE